MKRLNKQAAALWLFSAVTALSASVPAWAEVTLHSGGAPMFGDITVDGNDGTLRGTNLFHSFSTFNINTGEKVTFTPHSDPVSNIISRVTGTGSSTIDGPLISFPKADFFFINPNGVMFGPNARISVGGSFHVSTANAVHLGEDIFFADPSLSTLSTAPLEAFRQAPSGFGFSSPTPGAIDVAGAKLRPGAPVGGLNIPAGATMSLVGGEISISDAAEIGDATKLVRLVSAGGSAEVPIAGGIDPSTLGTAGTISVTGGSLVDAGEVFIRGGRFVVNQALVSPGGFSKRVMPNNPTSDGGIVDVEVTGDVDISGTEKIAEINEAPGIFVFGAFFTGESVASVSVRADTVKVHGNAAIRAERESLGGAGGIEVWADRVEIRNGATISSGNFFPGAGTDLKVTANDLLLSREGNEDTTGISAQGRDLSGIFLFPIFQPGLEGSINSGNITIDAPGALSVLTGAEIISDNRAFGSAGDVSVTAGTIQLSRNGATTGGITSQSVIAGDGGAISITTPGALTIKSGFQISATSAGFGNSGQLTVNAGSIALSGDNSGLFSTAADRRISDLDALAAPFGASFAVLEQALAPFGKDLLDLISDVGLKTTPGVGGSIAIRADNLTMIDNTRIDATTRGDGVGGNVILNVDTLSIRDSSQIRSRSGAISLDPGAALVAGKGDGGQVTVNAREVLISGTANGQPAGISTSTFRKGNGGNVRLTVDKLTISNSGAITSESLSDGLFDGLPEIPGIAGDITITAGDRVVLLGNATISTEAKLADGGNIVINAVELLQLDNSQITTSVQSGVGSGGNITIDPAFVVLNNSKIIANAFGGPGGNISITAGQFISSPNSAVTASSAKSVDGNVDIDAPDSDLSSTVAVLPGSFFDATSLLRGQCDVQRGRGGGTTLVVSSPGGVPLDPDGYLASYASAEASATTAAAGNGRMELALSSLDLAALSAPIRPCS